MLYKNQLYFTLFHTHFMTSQKKPVKLIHKSLDSQGVKFF